MCCNLLSTFSIYLVICCLISINDYIHNNIIMPQLVPFFFINQVVFAFAIFVLLIYVFSKYILPRFVRLFATRVFISKL
ncbi:MAG: hypothetical protein EOP34_01530 [Rickettsiales bacterium]|nr:MAG: hypothetical protein EOP34_01530 [Rickettsiales bacterium]